MSSPLAHGDPEGMRSTAAAWLARAEALGAVAGSVRTTVLGAGFEGPAAARLGRRGDGISQEGMAVAGALQALAEEMLRDARLVESLNAEAARAVAAEDAAAQATPAVGQSAASVPSPAGPSTPAEEVR